MTNPDVELANSLNSMKEEGEWQGSGSFSLASERAQAMMERFLLEEPRAYVLNLISAGVASGATGISLLTDADDCIVRFDGVGPTHSELEQLLSYAMDEEAPTRLREMALGVFGARALKPRWVKVKVISPTETQILKIAERLEVETLTSGGAPSVEVHMKESLSIKAVWRALDRPENRLVSERCRCSPVPISINGDPLRRFHQHGAALSVSFSMTPTDLWLRDWQVHASLPRREVESSDLTAAVFIWSRLNRGGGALKLVVDGVTFDCEDELGWEGVTVLVFCSGLQKDLSQRQVVRGQSYLRLLMRVREFLNEQVEHLLQNWLSLNQSARQLRLDLLEAVVTQARTQVDSARAVHALKSVVEIREAVHGPNDEASRASRLELMDCTLSAGRIEEGFEILMSEIRREPHLEKAQFRFDLLARADSLMASHPGLGDGALIEVLEGLAIAYFQRGSLEEGQSILKRLEHEYPSDGAESPRDRLEKLRLECQVANLKTATTASGSVCSRCGGGRMMKGCRVRGYQGGEVEIEVGQRNPEALVFTYPISASIRASICGDCGHVEFVAENPRRLWTDYLSIQKKKREGAT
jgi:hypothetical protein